MVKGVIQLLVAAFLFALATLFVKLAVAAPYGIAPMVPTFARFVIGFVMFALPLALQLRSLKANNFPMVSLRAVMNTVAVIFFFAALGHTTITKANILNLTYPAFVFMIAPLITREKPHLHQYFFLGMTLLGSVCIVMGGNLAGFGTINKGDLLALGSGLCAAVGISGLREARKYDSAQIILFYQMAFGTALTGLLVYSSFVMPTGCGLLYVIISAVLANVGQYLLTDGYRYITAPLGSLVSESGVLFAAVLGIGLLNDPVTPFIIVGGILVIVSIAGVSGMFNKRVPVS